MRVALIGASGAMGSCVLAELLDRGHIVTGICRNPAAISARANLTLVAGDAEDEPTMSRALSGHDAIIISIRFLGVRADRVLAGVVNSGVKRVILVGHAGTLIGPDGRQLVDTDAISPFFKPEALDAREAFKVFRQADDLDWTYATPASLLTPGKRIGEFRLGGEKLLRDRLGESRISFDDFAIAIVDELEDPQHIRQRFSAAY